MEHASSAAAEFRRPIDISRLPPGEVVLDITATPAERTALTGRFALLALDRLEAQVTVGRLAGGLLRVAAHLSADVVQECVVTLEPLASTIEDRFSLLYGEAQGDAAEVVLSGEAELVEPLTGGVIDIGEVVAQQLSLALDPFPRAPGAAAALSEAGGQAVPSPFAALAKWKEKG